MHSAVLLLYVPLELLRIASGIACLSTDIDGFSSIVPFGLEAAFQDCAVSKIIRDLKAEVLGSFLPFASDKDVAPQRCQ